MQLNCKQGDIAIIVKSAMGNEGKIVRCLEYIGPRDDIPDIHGVVRPRRQPHLPLWRIDRPIAFGSPEQGIRTEVVYCADAYLRPLRGDITDEEIETTKELTAV